MVDGFSWSSSDVIAGLRFKAKNGNDLIDLRGEYPEVNDSLTGILSVNWPLATAEGKLKIVFEEDNLSITLDSNEDIDWVLEWTYDKIKNLPFEDINDKIINCQFMGFDYSIRLLAGKFTTESGSDIFIIADGGKIIFDLGQDVQ